VTNLICTGCKVFTFFFPNWLHLISAVLIGCQKSFLRFNQSKRRKSSVTSLKKRREKLYTLYIQLLYYRTCMSFFSSDCEKNVFGHKRFSLVSQLIQFTSKVTSKPIKTEVSKCSLFTNRYLRGDIVCHILYVHIN
jgi:hypothetical protein